MWFLKLNLNPEALSKFFKQEIKEKHLNPQKSTKSIYFQLSKIKPNLGC